MINKRFSNSFLWSPELAFEKKKKKENTNPQWLSCGTKKKNKEEEEEIFWVKVTSCCRITPTPTNHIAVILLDISGSPWLGVIPR